MKGRKQQGDKSERMSDLDEFDEDMHRLSSTSK